MYSLLYIFLAAIGVIYAFLCMTVVVVLRYRIVFVNRISIDLLLAI